MPFKSRDQQAYLESDSSPLTAAQKRDFEKSTNFKTLPKKAPSKGRLTPAAAGRIRTKVETLLKP